MFKKLLSTFIGLCLLLPITTLQADSYPAIHVFGDSHSWVFNKVPLCVSHTTVAVTMHRVGRDGLKFIDTRKFGVKEGDALIYAFGEVDVRSHIGKQRDLQGTTAENIVNTLVHNYMQAIASNVAFYKKVYPIIYLIVPPYNHGVDNPNYPRYGTIQDRVAITHLINDALRKACQAYGYQYLDSYNDYATPEGYLRQELSDGNVHIRVECNAPVVQKLNVILQGIYGQSFDALFSAYRKRTPRHHTLCPICIAMK